MIRGGLARSAGGAGAAVYDARFVSGLFDGIAAMYGRMNYVTSFGFCERWRRQCVDAADVKSGAVVYDLMSGMGECWGLVGVCFRCGARAAS